jgi:hypothetical protein
MNEEKMEFINGNQLAIGSDGWALLAPFGDTAYPLSAGGKNEVVIQRITKENATEMVNAFKSVVGKVARWIKGSPIFLGHPDDPQTGHKYPVKDQVGMFADLEVRENGLYVRPMFNDKGAEILDKPEKYYFSGRWPVKHTGQRGDMRVFEPINITSIGMTRNPNLPTELLNEKPKPDIMEKTKLIALLATAGITLSNEATDEQIEAALKGFGASKKDAETTLANERASITTLKAELETLKSENAKARNAEITALINERITSGAITEAEKALWTKRLETNFVNEAPALQSLASKMKTQQNPSVSGNRARNPVSQPEAGVKLVSFANEKRDAILKSNPTMAIAEAFRLGYAEAEKEHPDLVEQLNTNKA